MFHKSTQNVDANVLELEEATVEINNEIFVSDRASPSFQLHTEQRIITPLQLTCKDESLFNYNSIYIFQEWYIIIKIIAKEIYFFKILYTARWVKEGICLYHFQSIDMKYLKKIFRWGNWCPERFNNRDRERHEGLKLSYSLFYQKLTHLSWSFIETKMDYC